jgi:hypothetical protein
LLGLKSRRDVACAAKLLVLMGLYFAATLHAGFAILELAKLRSNHALCERQKFVDRKYLTAVVYFFL